MRNLWGGFVALGLAVAACGPAVDDDDIAGTGTSTRTSEDGGASTTTTAEEPTATNATTDDPATTTSGNSGGSVLPLGCECVENFECDCVEEFSPCFGLPGPCEAPSPCSEVDETDPEATTCVLELLRDRTFARFSYCHLCGGYESYSGEFYIVGPNVDGLDVECHSIDLSLKQTIQYYQLESPEYFADCLAMEDFAMRRDCLFGGFERGESFEHCEI